MRKGSSSGSPLNAITVKRRRHVNICHSFTSFMYLVPIYWGEKMASKRKLGRKK
jgi:hypothetical protein